MGWNVRPLTPDRFEDFVDVVNRTRRDTHCWCVTHRLRQPDVDELGDGSREQAMRTLATRTPEPGVIAYHDDVPVAWCNIGPRVSMPRLVHSRVLRPVDDVSVWSIICVIVRPGHRRQGATTPLLEGAVAFAASHGAPAVEAYPVDPDGRMDLTMAFVGTVSMFDKVDFTVIGETDAVAGGLPRTVMRRDLRDGDRAR